jgi:hypothetical protein
LGFAPNRAFKNDINRSRRVVRIDIEHSVSRWLQHRERVRRGFSSKPHHVLPRGRAVTTPDGASPAERFR